MNKENIPNVHENDLNSDDRKRDMVDPAVIGAVGGSILLFVAQEALKAIVGFLTLKWFRSLWKEWFEKDESNTEVPKETQGGSS